MIWKNKISRIVYSLLVLLTAQLFACSYGMNAGAIDYSRIKTISIYNFPNESNNGPAYLSQTFSEKLRLYMQNNTRLVQVKNGGDWELEGRITKYELTPVSPQANQTAGINRLTIEVEVIYTNNKADEERNEAATWKQRFSFYGNFPQDQTLSENEVALIETISDQIIQDIYNKLTSNW